jgi:hypothetical protein
MLSCNVYEMRVSVSIVVLVIVELNLLSVAAVKASLIVGVTYLFSITFNSYAWHYHTEYLFLRLLPSFLC